MSARPDLARLSDEELDVLLSRSLDGDLSPEEERELSAFLASDPRAARRREELAGLVARLNALPAPAAPLGMTARVNARAADHAKGFGAIWHRLGIFPPPAMVRGIAALFVIVLIGMNVLRSQSVRQKLAEEAPTPAPADDRVAIFFDEKKPAAPVPAAAAPAPAPKSAARESQTTQVTQNAEAKRDAPARLRSEAAPAGAPAEQAATGGKGERGAAAALEADASRKDSSAAKDALVARPEAAGSVEGFANEAALQKKMKAQAAPPAPALAAAGAPISWDVAVLGPPARSWALRRFAAPPPARAGISASYRLTLDEEGKVVAAKALEGTTPETDALVRSLVFTSLGPHPPAEIEVTVRTR
ncbi:MAG TPA: hypothetical protein VL084_11540 [Thermoanaerobaculia bacterium]|nr:hypothetical protein [Thermoanaerobaculia bacterium]